MGQTFVTRAVHAAAAILSLVFSACGVVTQEIYMQEVDVKAPVFQPPVFIADSAQAGQFRLSPHLSFRNATTFRGFVEGHTRVNRDGVGRCEEGVGNHRVDRKRPTLFERRGHAGRERHHEMGRAFAVPERQKGRSP